MTLPGSLVYKRKVFSCLDADDIAVKMITVSNVE